MTSSKTKIAKQIIIVTLLALFSDFFGFLRDVLIAFRYGTGPVSDTYFAVAGITILLFSLIINATITASIPVFSQIENDYDKAKKITYVNKLFNFVGLLMICLVIVVEIFSPTIIGLIAGGFSPDQYQLAVKLLRLGIPGIIFSGMVGVQAGYLQSEGKYYASSSTRIAFNLACIIYLLFMSDNFGISGLMVAAVIGTVSQLFLLRYDLKSTGYHYKFSLTINDPYTNKFLALNLPVFIGIAIYDLNAMLDRAFASTLPAGSVSQLTYANKIETLVISVFVSAITTVIYPKLSKKVAQKDLSGLKEVFLGGLKTSLIITIPASIGLIVLGTPIVQVLYQRGEFDHEATIRTGYILAFYALGLIAKSVREIVVRVFYAMQKNKIALLNGGLMLAINFALNFVVLYWSKVELLAFTTSIAVIISTFILLYKLKRQIGSSGLQETIIYFLKSLVAASIMGIFAFLTFRSLTSLIETTSNIQVFVILLLTIILAGLVYIVLLYIFQVKEIRDLIKLIKQKKEK